jgi:hypothetical protein
MPCTESVPDGVSFECFFQGLELTVVISIARQAGISGAALVGAWFELLGAFIVAINTCKVMEPRT